MALVLSAADQQHVRVLRTFMSLPRTGNQDVGYTAQELFDEHNLLFPGDAFADVSEVDGLLRQGAKRGVYTRSGCDSGVDPPQQKYVVNHGMAGVNYANRRFLAAFDQDVDVAFDVCRGQPFTAPGPTVNAGSLSVSVPEPACGGSAFVAQTTFGHCSSGFGGVGEPGCT